MNSNWMCESLKMITRLRRMKKNFKVKLEDLRWVDLADLKGIEIRGGVGNCEGTCCRRGG